MAQVCFENSTPETVDFGLDLCLEDFAAWTWAKVDAKPNVDANAASGLEYQDFKNVLRALEPPKRKSNNLEDAQDQAEEEIGGLFRIRWNPATNNSFSSRTGILNVAYGFRASRSSWLRVTSYPDDILYIGKARVIKERVSRMFSTQQSSNAVARKIATLIAGTDTAVPLHQKEDIKDKLDTILQQIVFDFIVEPNPIKRDFMKAYAVSIEKPCLNIGLEH